MSQCLIPIGKLTIGAYVYDKGGKRIKKISAAETTVFVYNAGGQLAAEYSTQTAQTPRVSYLTTDHLGSPRVVTDENGTVVDRKDYTSFGEDAKELRGHWERNMFKGLCKLILVIVVLIGTVYAQDGEVQLSEKRISIQMTRQPLLNVFAVLTIDYDIPIGLEESILDIDHRHYDFETAMPSAEWRARNSGSIIESSSAAFSEHLITVNADNARIEDVMDAIVRQMENYDWEIRNEVVNIFPVEGRDERLERLMDVEVASFFAVAGEKTGALQARLLLFTPEITEFLEKNGLEADTTRFGPRFTDLLVAEEMVFEKMKFKDLLNAITKEKRGGWIVRLKRERRTENGKSIFKEVVNVQVD